LICDLIRKSIEVSLRLLREEDLTGHVVRIFFFVRAAL
jgi:hypothetical protein